MSDYQTTVDGSFTVEGVGVHTGAGASVRVGPAEADAGFTLLVNGAAIPALAEYVVDTRRATTLGRGSERVSTVEHILSALYGMGIDNALIEVEGPEVPIADGSAADFCSCIERAGVVRLEHPRRYLRLDEPVAVVEGDSVLVALPSATFLIRIAVDHGPPIGAHTFSAAVTPQTYRSEIAVARTYCSLAEARAMQEQGLARGGSLDRALVFDADGPLTPLRWPGEPARHKALDLIGDLALVGARVQAEIVAYKSGHRLHVRLATKLREARMGSAAALAAASEWWAASTCGYQFFFTKLAKNLKYN